MRHEIVCCLGVMLVWAESLAPSVVSAQQSSFKFKNKISAQATGTERQSQISLWVLDVRFTSLRQVLVEIPDPKTGKPREERIVYLLYSASNPGLGTVKDTSEETPQNQFDPDVLPATFAPEFTLITNDNGMQKIYEDVLVPEAQKVIEIREKVRENNLRLKNSVEVVGPIPAEGAPASIVGVAMWRGVDPRSDYFTILMSGFSNGYKLVQGPVSYQALMDRKVQSKLLFSDQVWSGQSKWRAASETYNLFDEKKPAPADADSQIWFYTTTPDRVTPEEEKPIIWRKTIAQRYWRPGDDLKPQEREFREQGDPEWIFQPDDVRIPVVAQPGPKAVVR